MKAEPTNHGDTVTMGAMSRRGKQPFVSLFTPGQELLQGRLIIGSQIGKGGMGVVYRATDTLLHRNVAVKTLSRHGIGRNPISLRPGLVGFETYGHRYIEVPQKIHA